MYRRLVQILLSVIGWCSAMVGQTPFDDFAPETSRIILDKDSMDAWRAEQRRRDTIYLVLVDDEHHWISVDPLLDKNIATSPYMYCNGNPVMLIDPDGRKVIYNDVTGDCETMVGEYCSQSELFNIVYNQLAKSSSIYTYQFGETVSASGNNVDGQFVPNQNGGLITLNRDGAWSSSIPEETFHALQWDNHGKYNDSQLNLEFEAKVFVVMSGLPTGSYYGMDDSYRASLITMDHNEFLQPHSVMEYIRQANLYSGFNSDNIIGNKNYWTPTTISPFNILSILGRNK